MFIKCIFNGTQIPKTVFALLANTQFKAILNPLLPPLFPTWKLFTANTAQVNSRSETVMWWIWETWSQKV